MENQAWNVRISVLWLIVGIGLLGQALLNVLKPGALAQVMSGIAEGMEITQTVMLGWAVFFTFPLVMAVLTLTLRDSINRWANFVVGIAVVILGLVGLVEYYADAYAVLILATRFIVGAAIVWLAYKWPKEKA
jgi:hypothetical protein